MCLSHSQARWIAPFLLWAALLSCSAAQHGFRLAEYEGQVLVATEGRGAARVRVEADYDSTIDEWIFQHGRPDYLHVESGDKVEFCYLAQDRAIVFTRQGWRRRSSVEIVRPVPDRLARFFVGQDREHLRSSREVASGHGGVIYATTTANIREGPGLSYPVVAKAVPAQALAYRYQQAEWYRLARHGWIHRSVVSRTVQAPPDYEIAAVEDTSIGSVKRLQYRVRLSRGASEQELTTISESIIKAAPPQNGLDILYYLPESSVDGGYTAGKADWWPTEKSQMRRADALGTIRSTSSRFRPVASQAPSPSRRSLQHCRWLCDRRSSSRRSSWKIAATTENRCTRPLGRAIRSARKLPTRFSFRAL